MISVIYSVEKQNDKVFVDAVIEDVIQIKNQTLYDPPEYGPALCKASFDNPEDYEIPENEDDLIEYLESLDLDWDPIEVGSDDDF